MTVRLKRTIRDPLASLFFCWSLLFFGRLFPSTESFVIVRPARPTRLRVAFQSIPWKISKNTLQKSSTSPYEERGGDDDDEDIYTPAELPDESSEQMSRSQLDLLNVSQLKQQCRLRGMKVSGRRSDLIDRLLGQHPFVDAQIVLEDDDSVPAGPKKTSKATEFAQEKGNDLIDVSAYLEEEDMGQSTKSSIKKPANGVSNRDDDTDDINASRDPEVWGSEARIVDDYEGRKVVVDSLTQSLVEYKGSNQTFVQAYVVASRDALKPFLAGGDRAGGSNATSPRTQAEQHLREIQIKREQASRRPIRFEDDIGLDEGDETGLYANILDREFSDWGEYTQTGAQLSAAEVQGVLLLSDVYGAFTDDTRALAEKIAFECQPIVVMVPDLFHGKPWVGGIDSTNDRGQTYEQWRAQQDELRVSVDIRAAAACLRERYGVSSVVVWGTCYGGGRALEIASGYLPSGKIHDIDGRLGPPNVNPVAAIVWYPSRYNAKLLFGKDHLGTETDINDEQRKMAVMGVFAGKDKVPGATKSDAEDLKRLLEQDFRVKDHMVKVFPGQEHGFAHVGLSTPEATDDYERFVDEEFGGAGRVTLGNGDAEVACLLSTAFMETYSRVFLPTVGPPISLDEKEASWGQSVEMIGVKASSSRDIREEIDDALDKYVDEPLGGYRIDPNDESQEEELKRVLVSMQSPNQKDGPFAIEEDDNLETVYAKLKASDPGFQIF